MRRLLAGSRIVTPLGISLAANKSSVLAAIPIVNILLLIRTVAAGKLEVLALKISPIVIEICFDY